LWDRRGAPARCRLGRRYTALALLVMAPVGKWSCAKATPMMQTAEDKIKAHHALLDTRALH